MSIAITRPELVKSLVLIGANYHHSATVIEIPFAEPNDEDKAEYAMTSPDAPHTLVEKIKKMLSIWDTEPDIPLSDLAKIQCPTLIIVGHGSSTSKSAEDAIEEHAQTLRLSPRFGHVFTYFLVGNKRQENPKKNRRCVI